MQNSVLLDLPTPLALVCHDAGAANLVFSWIRTEMAIQPDAIKDWRLLVQGPAARLWSENNVPQIHLCQTIDELLDDALMFVSGTGWASNLEYDSLDSARQRNIPTISVIDHWVNYRARFMRNEVEILPDIIWVTDGYAKKMAENEFNGITVVEKPNLYLEKIVQEIQQVDKSGGNNNLLYVLEPVRSAWGEENVAGEFKALHYFIQNLDALEPGDNLSIRLRPHPSDTPGKYDQWIDEQIHLNITLDNSLTLAESIAWSDRVVGCQTYAMIVALAAGKQVFSSIPPWAPSCVLPHEGIIKISDLVQKSSVVNDYNAEPEGLHE